MVDAVGTGGDILLYHEDVNSGVRFGLQLFKAERVKNHELGETFAEHVTTQYIIDGEAMTKHFFFTVLAMELTNELGDPRDRDDYRDLLLEVIDEGSDIVLVTFEGVFAALKTDGHTITEMRYEEFSILSIRLVAENAILAAADETLFFASEWQSDVSTDSKWDDNYWR